jgi:ribonucleoside-diphosphate reductase alpha chain
VERLIEPQLSPNAVTVLRHRYLRKDAAGTPVEAPRDMFWRVARDIASADTAYDPNADTDTVAREFYDAMANLLFLPNSPTLMNAGRDLQQLSACFVLPVGDSLESIFEALKQTALIHKSGGGTGFSFSRLRPKCDVVKTTHGISSGPVSFMTVFDAATETIKQGGTRRGANMGILRVDHPDIEDFITAKRDHQRLNNFNLSVGLTEAFMEAVERDGEYALINPRSGEAVKSESAQRIFDLIVQMAWESGEPGIIFLDRMNAGNPTPALGEIESTNPCGEQPLLPYESCNLGSINLAKMLKREDGAWIIDFDLLRRMVHLAVHFLDNVIDRNHFPVQQIAEMTRANRKIGLGVMGFADLLYLLELPYDSEEALKTGEALMSFIQEESRYASRELAKVRGPFPNFPRSVYAETGDAPIRNATTTTIAPTGTISIISATSSGIEPVFSLAYTRNILDGQRMTEVNPVFAQVAEGEGFSSTQLFDDVARQGSIAKRVDIPERARKIFRTAMDITPEWHIRQQATFQRYTDNAVSKTVNFHNSATVEEIREAYLLAHRLGCKGVTVYRDKSRDAQVLTLTEAPPETVGVTVSIEAHAEQPHGLTIRPRSRPEVTSGETRKIKTGCGNLYITVNADEQGIFEVFTQIGKAGGCAASQAEAVSRLISLALRAGIDPWSVVKQLKGVRCPAPQWEKGGMILSCADGIAKAMERYLSGNGMGDAADGSETMLTMYGACPECGGVIEHEGGCEVCRSCGFSRCE